jgi:hypothetical protein
MLALARFGKLNIKANFDAAPLVPNKCSTLGSLSLAGLCDGVMSRQRAISSPIFDTVIDMVTRLLSFCCQPAPMLDL